MYKGGPRIVPIILVVAVMIVAIIALVSIGRLLLNRGDSSEVVDTPTENALLMAEVDRSVRMTVRGPIVADENFNSYKIEISPTERRMTTYRGYSDEVIESRRLSNSVNAYTEFIHALDRAGFANTAQLDAEVSDVRGMCSTGRLYSFETLQAQSVLSESWISSCKGATASFRGEAVLIRDLFLRQIPDSKSLLSDLSL